ncbi:hypothetical protein [Xanthocytophaga agilis]|uniref:Signal peptide-containing protein n=1 Tax=Xanthocytophaga agilis TaxID=3048010 RepID=A0AAE3UHK8_9BACT|nr:hypothetical protein [Xanthocytophaga agilis]MDJ1506098.1 hypothetical protein [Xanthocytophaga agilis]
MKKFLTLILIVVIASLIGGLYGILHDQLTYTISPEYYTKFKFYQFGLMDLGTEAIFPSPRIEVSVVGFMATWWMGLLIGLILGLVGLVHKNNKQMFRATMGAISVTILIAFVTGLIGLVYGRLFLADTDINWWIPEENLVDKKSFIAVGSMHNFSYAGGLIGLLAGIVYSISQKRKHVSADGEAQ